jgi:hypothetical protein
MLQKFNLHEILSESHRKKLTMKIPIPDFAGAVNWCDPAPIILIIPVVRILRHLKKEYFWFILIYITILDNADIHDSSSSYAKSVASTNFNLANFFPPWAVFANYDTNILQKGYILLVSKQK